jgi:hypothetical protein
MQNDAVGTVKVPAETLLEAQGERLEFKLNPAAWVVGDDAGHIAIRCRPVTAYDREFMAHLKSQGSRFFSLKTKQTDFMGIDQGYDQLMKTAGGKITAKDLLKKNRKKGTLSAIKICYLLWLLSISSYFITEQSPEDGIVKVRRTKKDG